MNRPRVHALLLNAVLVVGSAFYLLSPGVYAYFSEAGMSYSRVPKWFAATPPARITARVFDRYNAHAPRASRFNRQLACYLQDVEARRGPGCTHAVGRGQSVHGPNSLRMASGQYAAHFGFADSETCSGGDARLEVVTTGRFGRVLAEYAGRLMPGARVDLPFHLKSLDAALAPVEFRVTGLGGCVLLSHVDWTQTPELRVAAAY
jgi:hypothetical protein